MSDILQQLIRKQDPQIETGFIISYLGNKRYAIDVNGVKKTMKSVIEKKLFSGERVVINKREHEYYIIGSTQQLQTREEKEIILE